MIKYTFIFVLASLSMNMNAQGKYAHLDHRNFREYPDFNQKINPEHLKTETLNAAIFFATNEIRAKKRLTILEYNKTLEIAAEMHSADMAKHNFFGHTNTINKKRKEPEDRARIAGVTNPSIAENVIEGFLITYKSGENVKPGGKGEFIDPKTDVPLPFHTYISLTDVLMELWMNSKGHRANILSKDALQLGCGTAQYTVSNFNYMPAIKATQVFQWYQKVNVK